jgi:dipeptidyl aminopeptidase/acylaminoacyl peptidase
VKPTFLYNLGLAAAMAAVFCAAPAITRARAAEPPAARDFARYALIGDISISRDGKHIAGLVSPDGAKKVIAIWETANPDKAPTILGSAKMELMSVRFVKDDRLAVVAQQLWTYGSTKAHLQKIYITDLQGSKWTSALPENRGKTDYEELVQQTGNPSILSTLPNDPQHILVINTGANGAGDVYKVNLYDGTADRVTRGSDRFGGVEADHRGELRTRQNVDFDNGKVYVAQQIRDPQTGEWVEHFRSYAKDRNLMTVVGFSDDPNIIYVNVRRDSDKSGIYEYDIKQKKITEPAFEIKLFDADGPILDDEGHLEGFNYSAETRRQYWTDPTLAAIAKNLPQALGIKTTSLQWTDPGGAAPAKFSYPDGAGAVITAWSKDKKYVIVEKSGPNLPPEYYLLTDGTKLTLLGKSRPQINGAVLGESRLVEYAARDGLLIPAFLHTPPKDVYGPGPYPAIVLPHGGPSARDELGWDVSGWTKYFTARGYVVIQPQFRGSEGWGSKLARAGDAQWGKTMQDDNDDAAKYLIEQKLAAPDRIALFGYSYGGYAAFVAAIRPNGLYQCSVAGAGVAEIKRFQGETYNDRFLREYQRPTIDGLDPLSNAKNASIPIFVYHGDRDQTVEVEESRRFVAALKAAGKPYKYLEIKDMGHQYNFMTPDMLETQLVEIEKYLKTDCGPGGL